MLVPKVQDQDSSDAVKMIHVAQLDVFKATFDQPVTTSLTTESSQTPAAVLRVISLAAQQAHHF
jgi:hypothetical protein